MAATAPIANWLADYYGRKRLFFIGTFIFFISAFFTGFAYSFPVMILCRGLSAIGAGTIIPLSIALIESVFEARFRAIAVVIFVGVAFGVGTVGGVYAGGVAAESWRLLFSAQIIFAPFVLFATWVLLYETERKQHRSFDFPGVVFYLVMIASGVSFMANVRAPWNPEGFHSLASQVTLGLFVLSTILFIIRELRARDPLLDVRLLRIRSFFLANAALIVISFTNVSTVTSLTKVLESDLNFSIYETALYQIPFGLALGIFGSLSGLLTRSVGVKILAITGMVLVAISCFLNQLITVHTGYAEFAWVQAIRGAGLGFSIGPLTAYSFKKIERGSFGQAAVIVTLVRQLGVALGPLFIDLVEEIRQPILLQQLGGGSGTNIQANILAINEAYIILGWTIGVVLIPITLLMIYGWSVERRKMKAM